MRADTFKLCAIVGAGARRQLCFENTGASSAAFTHNSRMAQLVKGR
jgi:hypothetical protein